MEDVLSNPRPFGKAVWEVCSPFMMLSAAAAAISGFARTTRAAAAIYPAVRAYSTLLFSIGLAVFYRQSRRDAYDVLWVVVFAFATLNILGLAARRVEPGRRGLSFGELMAVGVVLLSVVLLAWEMLGSLHIFPIKLHH